VSEAEVVSSPTTLPSTVGYKVAATSSTPSVKKFFTASKHPLVTSKPLSLADIDLDAPLPDAPMRKKKKIGE
jgi:hypothetical protein